MLNETVFKEINRNIIKLRFEEAYNAVQQIGFDDCWDRWSEELCYKKPMVMYNFLMYCIARTEKAQLHFYIFQLLIYIRPFFDDPYILAYWHLKRALDIEPQNIDYMRWFIKAFAYYPEKITSNEELLFVANQLLQDYPDDKTALNVKALIEAENSNI